MSQVHSNLHRSAWSDWWEGTRRTDIWWTLAWFDIVLRYRRSMLGPLWLTLSMGAMIGGMGPLYSSLFGTELSKFFPHLALGIIFWGFFSSMVADACNAFVSSANYLKQGYFPISLFVWRSIARNLIQFAHQIVLYVPVAIWAGISIGWPALLVFPAFAIAIINAHALGLLLGLICTRYRDVTQIVTCRVGQGTRLSPTGHSAVHQPGIASQTHFGPKPQPFGHTGTKALDQSIRLRDETQGHFDRARVLEVERD